MAIVGRLCIIMDEHKPLKLFLDVIGIGAGVYDRLIERGYGNIVIAVNAGSTADNAERYFNKRAEMWGNMKEWLEGQAAVRIPDEDSIQADMMKPKYEYDSNSRIKLESKENMRNRGISSPDLADAIALTFAYKLNINEIEGVFGGRMPVRLKNKKPRFANIRI